MPDLNALETESLNVLSSAKGDPEPEFITTYQVLARLSKSTRDSLINDSTSPGQGAGNHASAANYLANSPLRTLANKGLIEVSWIDSEGLKFTLDGADRPMGNPRIALYRLKR